VHFSLKNRHNGLLPRLFAVTSLRSAFRSSFGGSSSPLISAGDPDAGPDERFLSVDAERSAKNVADALRNDDAAFNPVGVFYQKRQIHRPPAGQPVSFWAQAGLQALGDGIRSSSPRGMPQ